MAEQVSFPESNRKLKSQLREWEKTAPKAVKAEIETLRSGDTMADGAAKRAAARGLAEKGRKAKGAILALITTWTWSPKRERPQSRLKAARRRSLLMGLRSDIGKALNSMGAVAVEPLSAALKSRSTILREQAKVLRRMSDPGAVTPLITGLNDENALVRTTCAEALGGIGKERAIRPLFEAMGDRDAHVRTAAASALVEIGTPRAFKKLLDGLRSDDPTIHEAAKVLGKLRKPADPQVVDILIAALEDRDERVQVTVAKALGSLRDPRAVTPLISQLGSPHASVHRQVRRALDRIDSSWAESDAARRVVPELLAAMEEGDAALRKRVLETFRLIKDERAVGALAGALGDAKVGARAAAAQALGHQEDARGVDPLLSALATEESPARGTMALALARLGDPRAVEPITDLLPDHRRGGVSTVSHSAILALGSFKDPRAVGALIGVLEAPEEAGYHFREAVEAARALGTMGDQRAVEPLKAVMASHWTDGTRVAGLVGRAAREALEELGPQPSEALRPRSLDAPVAGGLAE